MITKNIKEIWEKHEETVRYYWKDNDLTSEEKSRLFELLKEEKDIKRTNG